MPFLSTEPEKPKKQGFSTISVENQGYPALLRDLTSPPPILYNRGLIENIGIFIAVVGSRKMTAYGQQCVEEIINGLSGFDITIVSGLAYGVDAHAHQTALKAGLKTIAVLGSGIDDQSVYPQDHLQLLYQIIENSGCAISEYPVGTRPRRAYFVQRNRMISGISNAVAVIEADSKSGALTTAEFARQQKRTIFAVPGSILSNFSSGTNNLLKNGATALTSAQDIIEHFHLDNRIYQENPTKKNDRQELPLNFSKNEQKVYSAISKQTTEFKEILAQTGLPIPEINSALTMLEIKNKIKAVRQNCYVRNLTRFE